MATKALATIELPEIEQHTEQRDPRSLVAQWLDSVAMSDNTRKAYVRSLAVWAEFLAGAHEHAQLAEYGPTTMTTATRAHGNRWARQMAKDGKSSATAARHLSAVSSFYGWLVDENLIDTNPLANVKRQRVSGTQAAALTADEVRDLFAAAGPVTTRDGLLVRILATAGLRVSELCDADVEDVRFNHGRCELIVKGKGSKLRTVRLVDGICSAIDATDTSNAVAIEATTTPLVPNNAGGRLNRHQVTRILKRLQRAAGISTTITPHVMRASMATVAAEHGIELHDLQKQMGHASPDTTSLYVRRVNADNTPADRLAAIYAQ